MHTHTHIYTCIEREVCVYIYAISKNYSINGFSAAVPSWLQREDCSVHSGLAPKVQNAVNVKSCQRKLAY